MSNTPPTAFDSLLIKGVMQSGSLYLPVRPNLSFADSRFVLADDPTNNATAVSIGPSVATPGISLAAGGTVTLTPAQYLPEFLPFVGTLPSNTTIVFPSIQGRAWTLDFTGVTFSTRIITLQANSNNWGTTFSTGGVLARITFNGTRLYGNTQAP